MAFTMLFPVSTCHDSVKPQNIEIRIVTRIVNYILLLLKIYNLWFQSILRWTKKLVMASENET